MNSSRFADIRARARGEAPNRSAMAPGKPDTSPEAEPDEDDEEEATEKEKDMTDKTTAAAAAETATDKPVAKEAADAGFDAGFAAAIERSNTVAASEHFAGREKIAMKMLANPKLSASDIVGLLADVEPSGGNEGLKMLEAMKASDADLGHDGDRKSDAADTNLVAKAHERLGHNKR